MRGGGARLLGFSSFTLLFRRSKPFTWAFWRLYSSRGWTGVPPDAGADDLAGENSGLRADDRTRLDAGVVAHSDLAADDAVVLDDRAAGDSGLCGDDDAFADVDVVSDLDEVVDLCAFADVRFAQGSAVDAGVRTDLDVVFDDDGADLREILHNRFRHRERSQSRRHR